MRQNANLLVRVRVAAVNLWPREALEGVDGCEVLGRGALVDWIQVDRVNEDRGEQELRDRRIHVSEPRCAFMLRASGEGAWVVASVGRRAFACVRKPIPAPLPSSLSPFPFPRPLISRPRRGTERTADDGVHDEGRCRTDGLDEARRRGRILAIVRVVVQDGSDGRRQRSLTEAEAVVVHEGEGQAALLCQAVQVDLVDEHERVPAQPGGCIFFGRVPFAAREA